MNKNYVTRCFMWLTNELVSFYETQKLPEELVTKMSVFYDCIGKSIDWFNLTIKDVKQLGFLNWDEDDESAEDGIWFIPNWLLPVIPEGVVLYDKDGVAFVYHSKNSPKQVMYGCLTFGVKLTKQETEND